MEKITHTKADCLTAFQAARRYKIDKEKIERVMKKLYINNIKVPGKPHKPVVHREGKSYRTAGESVAHKLILEEYNNMFPSR
ncbi:MAG: hypothetical protein UIC65_04390 [Alphaproteobacteria bacterium]|jgi:hypothetical protein|nr:hypothetical protein [Alphaproteobacteria bacterium]